MKKIGKIILNIVIIILVVISCGIIFTNTCYDKVVVMGDSMNPTLHNGDYGLATGRSFLKHVDRFDIIVFNRNDDLLIKRVIGLPGEELLVDEKGDIFINDKKVDQKFISDEIKQGTTHFASLGYQEKITIPKNSYYVLGDNRSNSYDSCHGLGYVTNDEIDGILKVIYARCESVNSTGAKVCVNKHYQTVKFY